MTETSITQEQHESKNTSEDSIPNISVVRQIVCKFVGRPIGLASKFC
jgi:hypothetical protein